MPRTLIRRLIISISTLVIILATSIVVLYFIGGSRINYNYSVEPANVAVPSDVTSIESGGYLAEAVTGCMYCHGDNLGGQLFFDEPGIAKIHAPNLTSGRGGIGAKYSDLDWVRAIRHGIAPDGKGLLIMPAEIFQNLSAEDLGSIIAFMKSVGSVDNDVPKPETNHVLGRVLIALGAFGEPLAAELIDHTAPIPSSSPAGPTVDHGQYLVSIGLCRVCHGTNLAGSQPPDPESPRAPDITSVGALAGWSEEDFFTCMRTGVRPNGVLLRGEFMPWDIFANMTDESLSAVWLYLNALPAGNGETRK